jgi:uncharacterized protein DUF4412
VLIGYRANLESMIHWSRVAGAVAVIATTPCVSAAQKQFEGTIAYDVTGSDRVSHVVISTRGKKVWQQGRRDDTPDVARDNYLLVDYDRGELMSVIPAMKRYMVVDFKKLRASVDESGSANSPTRLTDVVATGRKERIAGVACELYSVTSLPGSEWCITTELGSILGFDGQAVADGNDPRALPIPANNTTASLLRSLKKGALVLRMRIVDDFGRTSTVVATKIDRARPPASLFSIPSDFEEIQNPMLGRP